MIADVGLRQALHPPLWGTWALIAAVNWWMMTLGGWWPFGLVCALGAGYFTGVCLGPLILWVRGRHPRQLRR